MTALDRSALAPLRARMSGEVIGADDPGFAEARAAAIWNGDITRQPTAIARPRTNDDVVAAVTFARAEGIDLTVRGGGHAFAGHAVADGALMIDLSLMNTVTVDPAAKQMRCGGGASWGDVDAATTAHGLAVTGGFISHTGVAGLTLGGGFGWLTRAVGMSCDNLVSATVVTADGRVVEASEYENADLFWALRGGGGNFGVVHRVRVRPARDGADGEPRPVCLAARGRSRGVAVCPGLPARRAARRGRAARRHVRAAGAVRARGVPRCDRDGGAARQLRQPG
jgi:FAD/FMN-containing dehydrogenase